MPTIETARTVTVTASSGTNSSSAASPVNPARAGAAVVPGGNALDSRAGHRQHDERRQHHEDDARHGGGQPTDARPEPAERSAQSSVAVPHSAAHAHLVQVSQNLCACGAIQTPRNVNDIPAHDRLGTKVQLAHQDNEIPRHLPIYIRRTEYDDDVAINTLVGADVHVAAEADDVVAPHLYSRSNTRTPRRYTLREWWLRRIQVARLQHEIRVRTDSVPQLASGHRLAIDGDHTIDDLDQPETGISTPRHERDPLLQRQHFVPLQQLLGHVGCGRRLSVQRARRVHQQSERDHHEACASSHGHSHVRASHYVPFVRVVRVR